MLLMTLQNRRFIAQWPYFVRQPVAQYIPIGFLLPLLPQQQLLTACLQPGATVAMTPLALTIAAKAANHEAVGTQAFEAEAAGGGNQCAR